MRRTGGELGAAAAKAVQAARVEKLAVNLKAMLTRYVAGDVEGFKVCRRRQCCTWLCEQILVSLCMTPGSSCCLGTVMEVGMLSGGVMRPSPSACSMHVAAFSARMQGLLHSALDLQLAMKAEAEQLAGASFGETMLHAIGRVYEQQVRA